MFTTSKLLGPLPKHGTCVAALCPPGYTLKTDCRPEQCAGSICEVEECCEFPDNTPVARCEGLERQWGECTGLPKCTEKVPCYDRQVHSELDCRFAAWTDWTVGTDCAGICSRDRFIAKPNDEGGRPCSGPLMQTKRGHHCLPKHCLLSKLDCEWGDWSSWTTCLAPADQKTRSRKIDVDPIGGGKECEGAVNQTVPCAKARTAQDCEMSDWGHWTRCSASCGGGYQVRLRRIVTNPESGGKACEGALRETEACRSQNCPGVKDCLLGEWSDWWGCTSIHHPMRDRSRNVLQHSANGGKPCSGDVRETDGCHGMVLQEGNGTHKCKLGEWREWSACDSSCGNGQRTRTRPMTGCDYMTKDRLSFLSVKEMGPCNAIPCKKMPCKFSTWSDWSECSAKCGEGHSNRNRTIALFGALCEGSLAEVKGCTGKSTYCAAEDCKWRQWDDWSACTSSCGGGNKRRNRVVDVFPRHGGQLCDPRDKSEVAVCNTQSCEVCIDGIWGDWAPWSACSETCDSGFRTRNREVSQHPNQCGKPAQGLEDQFEICPGLKACVKDQDCMVSDWHSWSACTCTCMGVQERQRHFLQYASGKGKACVDEVLKEISPCNPNPALGEKIPQKCGPRNEVDCVMSAWEDWGICSATCEGGLTTRTRHVLQPNSDGGKPCSGVLYMVKPCGARCPGDQCKSCKWSEWNDWSSCSRCGNQRYRTRAIQQMPTCGRMCDARPSKEVSNCQSECSASYFCVWSDWSLQSKCHSTCEPSSMTRVRQLLLTKSPPALTEQVFMEGTRSMSCAGTQLALLSCPPAAGCKPSCVPQDCLFTDWSEWFQPTCIHLCERSRNIEHDAHCGGKECQGALVDTKRCDHRNCTTDCKVSEWSEWRNDGADCVHQQTRSRTIVNQPTSGGKPCEGSLEELRACNTTKPKEKDMLQPVDCELTSWSRWGPCSQDCGSGTRYRSRDIKRKAESDGAACSGTLHELEECNTQRCGAKCVLGDWHDWGHCSKFDTQARCRHVVNEGSICHESLQELRPCATKVDCQMSPWTDWDDCSRTCGSGQRERHRAVDKNPRNGGRPCLTSLVETAPCGGPKCPDELEGDCRLTDWTSWTHCSATCGMGYARHSRYLVHPTNKHGKPCNYDMEEAKSVPCHYQECNTVGKCTWEEWEDWSECSRSCGAGSRSRIRNVTFPTKKGVYFEPCPAESREELQACNTRPCVESCTDGAWKLWSDWAECTVTCGGGMTFRRREVLRNATACGKPLPGFGEEIGSCSLASCEPAVDCEFGDWSSWSNCSRPCTGTKNRTRVIKTPGGGDGKWCIGALQEVSKCDKPKKPAFFDWHDEQDYLNFSHIVHNNLGKDGPDTNSSGEPTIRYANVTTDKGRPVDMIVSANAPYKAHDSAKNGVNGMFGNINVKSGTVANLTFAFVYNDDGSPAEAKYLLWRIYDLDQGNKGKSQESVEAVGYTKFDLAPNTTVKQGSDAKTGDLVFTSSVVGKLSDNPSNPSTLTAEQETKAVSFQFGKVSKTNFMFKVGAGRKGRNFLFEGKVCIGCNVTFACKRDAPHSRVDCKLKPWSDWSTCSADCGGGQQSRHRTTTEPLDGGSSCEAALEVTRPCNAQKCAASCAPTDCMWGEWSTWGECDKCGGQRKRVRHILRYPECHGAACQPHDSQQIGKCTSEVACVEQIFCGWQEWEPWSLCSASCGTGAAKSRVRRLKSSLHVMTAQDGHLLEAKYGVTLKRPSVPSAERLGTFVVSFLCGSMSLFVAAGSVRLCSRRSRDFRYEPVDEAASSLYHQDTTSSNDP